MAELAKAARAGDARQAKLFRADGYEDAEITAYLYQLQHHEADDPNFIA